MKIAVIYGTTEGQMHKLAEYIGNMLRARGAEVEVLDGEVLPPEIPFSNYDGILIGTSVHKGAHQSFIVELADLHHRELNEIASGLFTVSINPAKEIDQVEAENYNSYFSDQTHWNPVLEATFRGALPKNHYGFMKCLREEALSKRRYEEVDSQRDYEFIDDVTAESFVDEFIDFLRTHEPTHRPSP